MGRHWLPNDFARTWERRLFPPALGAAPECGPQVVAAGWAKALRQPSGDAAAAEEEEKVVRGEEGEEQAREVEGEGEGLDCYVMINS